MKWMLMPLRRYADFNGRSRRREYWMFTLLNVIVSAIIALLGLWGADSRLFSSDDEVMLYFLLTAAPYSLAMLVPGIAVAVRRLHDLDKSGWHILFGLIPIVGGIILLVWYCTEGTRGPNLYGPDPLADETAQAFA